MVVFGAGATCVVFGFEAPPRCCAANGAAVINTDIARTRVLFMPAWDRKPHTDTAHDRNCLTGCYLCAAAHVSGAGCP